MVTIRAALATSLFGLALCIQSGYAQDKLKPGLLGGSTLLFSIDEISAARGVSYSYYFAGGDGKVWRQESGKEAKSLGTDGFPIALSSDGRYLISKGSTGSVTLNDLALKRQAKLPLKYPDKPGLENYTPYAVEVIDGKVTVVGTRRLGGYGDVLFVWTVGQGVRIIEISRNTGPLEVGGKQERLTNVVLSKDGTVFAQGQGIVGWEAGSYAGRATNEDGPYYANVGKLNQPLRRVKNDSGVYMGSPSGALLGRVENGGSRASVYADFGTMQWGPVTSPTSNNYRDLKFDFRSMLKTGSFLEDYYAGKPIESISWFGYHTRLHALTDTGFAVVSVRASAKSGWSSPWETGNEVVIRAPGEGDFTLYNYLSKKGIFWGWADTAQIVNAIFVIGTNVPPGIAVVEKNGYRFIWMGGNLYNLGMIPGYVAPPRIKPTATPSAPVA
jgi:hypothetical protein